MLVIHEGRDISDPPAYTNLQPLVDYLVARGNRTSGFKMTRDGWQCSMTEPLDIDLIRAEVELPSSILVSAEHDTVADRNTWAIIYGGRAVASMVAAREKWKAEHPTT